MTNRRNKIFAIAAASAMTLSLTACEGSGDKEGLGALGGAVLGGLAGSQFGDGRGQLVTTGLGALIGAVVGSEIGKSLDRADQLYLQQATQDALENAPSGQIDRWVNPDSGTRGTVRAEPAYQNNSGEYCREFQQTVTIGNETHDAYGTACRKPDGDWQIVG